MTDFDTILTAKLRDLDSSMPDPVMPVRPVRRASMRGRRVTLLLAAAVSLLGVTAVVAVASGLPRDPAAIAKDAADELRIRDDLAPRLANACLSKAEAIALFRSRLDALSLPEWRVRADERISRAPCVTGSPVGDSHEILLGPSMGPAAASATDAVAMRLMDACLDRNAAMAVLRDALTRAGIGDPSIEASGIRQVPVQGADAYVAHAAAGCYVYGGAAFDSVGNYTFYISGLGAG